MNRKVLTEIIQAWQLGLITRYEYRLALSYAIQGGDEKVLDRAIARVAELFESGVLSMDALADWITVRTADA